MLTLKRLSLSFTIVLTFLAGLVYFLPGRPDAAASPPLQVSTQTPIWRFLDTVGNGAGTKNAVGSTYATTPTTFYLQPPAGNVFDISRLVISVEDSAVSDATLYGAVLITNGVVLRRVSGSTIITLTDGIPVTTNLGWRRLCTVSTVTTQLQAICDFPVPIRLNGDKSEKLEIVLSDDLSGLTGHYFVVEGYRE